ncbi:MAG: MerR family transcriptional regulator [Gemmataceae bacterium]
MLSIGQVAKQAGVGVDTIRFYEKQSLLGKPSRTPGGYRTYDESAVRVLQFILQAKHLGFTLREIKQLLLLHRGTQSTRGDFRTIAREKLADIQAKIVALKRLRDALLPLVARCDGVGPLAGCPIVEALTKDLTHEGCHKSEE